MIYDIQLLRHIENFFVIMGHFLTFYQHPPSLMILKIIILKKKKCLEILSFHTYMCTIKEDHTIYGSWNICPFTPLWTQKIKILKKWNNIWRYYHFPNVYHRWQSYDARLLRYGVQQTEFLVILDCFFCPFTHLTTWKIKIF